MASSDPNISTHPRPRPGARPRGTRKRGIDDGPEYIPVLLDDARASWALLRKGGVLLLVVVVSVVCGLLLALSVGRQSPAAPTGPDAPSTSSTPTTQTP
jgi:hypothetical protein